ncbi:hypothetical protein H4R99_006548 [Coemansia sp. RSA 1722]|nr:hypothetical protein H4R99_006548 [Coemansia sp. RSA 1722]
MNIAMNGSAGDAFTSAASTENTEVVSNAASDHFSILNRPDFVNGINAFREHYGQEVRCKISEGYTFLGLDKATFNGSASTPQQQQQTHKAKSSQSSRAHGLVGASPAHSNSSQTSHTQHTAKESLSGFKGARPPPLAVTAADADAEATAPLQASAATATALAAGATTHSGNREKESTLDHLLSFMKNSPTAAPNTARTTSSFEHSLPSAATAAAVAVAAATSNVLFKKTTVMSQAQSRLEALNVQLPLHLTIELPSIERLARLRSGADRLKARAEQQRQQAMKQEKQERLERQERQERQVRQDRLDKQANAAAAAAAASSAAREARETSTKVRSRSKGSEPETVRHSIAEQVESHGKHNNQSAKNATASTGKRSAAEFVFQIRVPKKARRTVIDALALVQPHKRNAPMEDSELDTSGPSSNKRVRRSAAMAEPRASRTRNRSVSPSPSARSRSASPVQQPLPISTSDRHPSNGVNGANTSKTKTKAAQAGPRTIPRSPRHSRSRSSTRSSTRSTSLQRSRLQPVATPVPVPVPAPVPLSQQQQHQMQIGPFLAASSFSKLLSSVSSTEIEGLRRQSARLEENMRSFKHIGDAERGSGGKLALEVVYYLESLSCCMEDFWIRRAFAPLADTHKNWVTMLNICTYLYKKCESRDLSVLQGCTATITACVYYQLASIAFDLARGMKDLDEVSKTIGDASRYLSEMESLEQDSRQLLSAHNIARQLPQTWRRCQDSSARIGPFELRSNPYTKKWPSVAYPVGATSNPLDIANMVRQAGREWLDRAGLSLRMPNN